MKRKSSHCRFPSFKISIFALGYFWNWIVECVPFSKFIVVVFSLVSFIQVQIIFRKEMVMVLRADQFILIRIFSLVWIEKCCLVLPQFVVIILIVKVFVGLVCPFVNCWSKVIHNFLKPCLFRLFHNRLVHHWRNINVQSAHLVCDVVNCFLDVCLFSVCWEAQRLEWRQGSQNFLERKTFDMFCSDFTAKALIFFNWELDAMIMNKLDQGIEWDVSFHFSVDRRNDVLEAVTVIFDELFFEDFNGSVKLNFLFKEFGKFPFSSRFHNFVRHVVVSAENWSLHFGKKLCLAVGHVELESKVNA